jgi:hypothetical protein
VSKQTTISELHAKGCSLRRIALELGLNRRTVAAYANRSQKLGCDSSSNFTAEVTGGPPTERPASKAVLSQNTETFLRCLENAFRHFGGVPKVLNVDNLKAAVLRADWFDPEINPKFEAFCQHHQTPSRQTLRPGAPLFASASRLQRLLLKPDLLIIDDMGLKNLPSRSGEILSEIIMRRHENRSTLMTSNRPVEEWGQLLGNIPAASAILDRLLHRSDIIAITGPSYRLHQSTAHHLAATAAATTPKNAPTSPA